MNGQKILIIEDNRQIREDIAFILSMEGFTVHQMENGKGALELIKETVPDLILCDVMMPEVDGFEVLKTIRLDSHFQATPFIFLTARAAKEDQRNGMDLGADDYLTKPFTTEELKSAIHSRLKRREQTVEPLQAEILKAREILQRKIKKEQPNNDGEILEKILENGKEQISSVVLRIDRFEQLRKFLGLSRATRLQNRILGGIQKGLDEGDRLFQLAVSEFLILTQRKGTDLESMVAGLMADTRKIQLDPGQNLNLTISAGIRDLALIEEDPGLEGALIAAEHATDNGGNQVVTYTPELYRPFKFNQNIEHLLPEALKNREIYLVFQGRYLAETGELAGLEALLRWRSPELGEVSPMRFIPVAEQTGFILELGNFVLEQVMDCILEPGSLPTPRIAVNVSVRQLQEANFASGVLDLCTKKGISPEDLEVEITESMILDESEAFRENIRILREGGIALTIDDFGTGFAAYGNIRKLPISFLKIDRSFVKELMENREDPVINSIITMAHDLGFTIVAEGVETGEQLRYLKNHGVDEIQGYLFSHPLPFSEAMQLRNRREVSL